MMDIRRKSTQAADSANFLVSTLQGMNEHSHRYNPSVLAVGVFIPSWRKAPSRGNARADVQLGICTEARGAGLQFCER